MASRANTPRAKAPYFQRPQYKAPTGPNPAGTIINPNVTDQPAPLTEDAASPQHEGFRQHNTAGGEEMVGQDRAPVAPGEVSNRLRPGEVHDVFTLSDADLAAYGIEGAIPSCLADTDVPGDKVYVAVRAPAVYGKLEPSHLREKRQLRPSMKFVHDKEGNPVYATHDLIYAVVDRAEYLGRTERHNEYAHAHTRGLIEGRMESGETQEGAIENFRGSDAAFLRREREKYHTLLAGMKQNWPRGMSIEDIERHVGSERTLDIERKWARNGRTEGADEREKFTKLRSETVKRTYSVPGKPTK